MAVDSKNPKYTLWLPDWELMDDAYAGERTIKNEGVKYLPATSGQIADGTATPTQPGALAYAAYVKRARFPDFVNDAVEALVGVMHSKPATIELPTAMEPLLEASTSEGEGLQALLRRINVQQLVSGRIGLLLDVEDGSPVGTLPYIATYAAKSIINWDDGTRDGLTLQTLNLVSLDESEDERDSNFEWKFEDKTRIAILGDPHENEGTDSGSVYRVGVFSGANSSFSEDQMMTPSIGGRTLDEIPFVFINAADIVPCPTNPPLLGLAQLSISIYRGEADYRQALFMQGQDTLVVIGDTDPEATYRTGANASISIPLGGEAKYIGVESAGLEEMRKSLENDRADAAQRGGQLLDAASRQKESGEALRIRVTARTATLNQIVLTAAFGLQTTLRQMAKWIGANPDEVVVTPNLDFVDDVLEGKTLVEYMTSKSLGAPFSLESIHELMQQKGLTELSFEEEMALIEAEEPLNGGTSADDLGEEDEPEEDEQ